VPLDTNKLAKQIRDSFLKSLEDLEPHLRKHMETDPDVPIHWALVIDWVHHQDFPDVVDAPTPHRYAISSHAWPAAAPDNETILLLKDGIRHIQRHGTEGPQGPQGTPDPEAH
jgi:hypothetical protein